MEQEILIAIVALFSSLLTFFSGFGLGTLLLPAFALFFNVELAIGLTGVVHLLNNIFKTFLIGEKIQWRIGFLFGLPSIIGALIGSLILIYMIEIFKNFHYQLFDLELKTSFLKIAIGILIFTFTLIELIPNKKPFKNNSKNTIIGGLLSGFFGGISGHQGALRTLFLVRYKLSKEAFIATGIAIALAVDLTRLPVYFTNFKSNDLINHLELIAIAVLAAFTGSILGKLVLNKIKINLLHKIISICLLMFSIVFSLGIV